MKNLMKMSKLQKIIATITLIVVLSISIPGTVHADDGFGGKLLKPVVQLFASLGDVFIGLLQHYMLGTDNLIDSVMLSQNDPNVDTEGGSLYATGNATAVNIDEDDLDGMFWNEWKLPNVLYCPENIFANNIAALDVNFINPHRYNIVQEDSEDGRAEEHAKSMAEQLQTTIAKWYRAFRNISIVGLLSVLIYIGIRILLGSTAQDKAKYKERLIDWVVALCLVFFMQFIMSGILMVTEGVTNLLSDSAATRINVTIKGASLGTSGTSTFQTNLMGYMRLMVQSKAFGDAAAYTVLYLMLVIFTVMFTITYLKRVLYMAFLTMISPLVALTYPIDKIGDGKAQAFNMWFKEYLMNAILQPVHLILYTALVSSAKDLVAVNPIYAVVAIGFLIPAEKLIKKMFRLDRGETTGGLGGFAAGTLVAQAMNRIGKNASGKVNKLGTGNSSGSDNGDGLGSRGKNIHYAGGNPMNNAMAELGQGVPNPVPNSAQNQAQTPVQSQAQTPVQPPVPNLGQNQPTDNGSEQNPFVGTNINDMTQDSVYGGNQIPDISGYDVIDSRYVPNTSARWADSYAGTDSNLQADQGETERYESPSLRERLANTRVGRVAEALGDSASSSFHRKFNSDNVKRTLKNGAKAGIRTAARVGGAAALGLAVAPAAIAAGASTGDFGKAASIATGSVGVAATLGGNFAARGQDKLSGTVESTLDTAKNAWYTPEEQEERKAKQQEKYDRDWKADQKNRDYLKKKGVQNVDQYLKDEKTQAFLDAGITDIKMIHQARELMDESNGSMNIQGAVSRARLAKETSNLSDPTNKNAFMQSFIDRNPNMDRARVEKYISDVQKIQKAK